MRNIWAIVVGVVVAAGAGVALYNVLADRDPMRPTRVAATQPVQQAADVAALPRPAATFDNVTVTPEDFVLGSADAPVTVIEYASLTCPHCARFHIDVLPTIKADYIEGGRVRLVYRDFPLDNAALMAAVVARCGGRDRYFGFLDALFGAQDSWARSSDPASALSRIAALGGMSQSEFNACLRNQQIVDAVVKERLDGERQFGINSTPTIIVNGQLYSGGLSATQLRAVLDHKLN